MSFEVTGANLISSLDEWFFNILLTCNSQSRSFKYLLFIKKKNVTEFRSGFFFITFLHVENNKIYQMIVTS